MLAIGWMEAHDGLVRVLLVEDDLKLAQLTARYLETQSMVVSCVANGSDGFAEARRNRYDVVLLDVMLPGKSGTDVCRELRTRLDVPIIMLTARGDEADRVLGLELGADDYMTKPFSSRELAARIRALVRRTRGRLPAPARVVRVGPLTVDTGSRTAAIDGRAIDLTSYEFELLRVLAEHAGRVLDREQLLDLAKGSAEAAFDRSIDVHVSRLRQKLGDDPRRPAVLKTVRGAGYMLAAGGRR